MQMYNLEGKTALVTGTSNKRGLGREIALRLAREGADVLVTDQYRDIQDLDPWDRKDGWSGLGSLVAEIEALGRRALAVTADISSGQEVGDLVDKALDRFGKVDILVNNASVTLRVTGNVPVVDFREDLWTRTIAVNLTGVFLMCKAVARRMIEQGQGGKIVNISSNAGKRAIAGRAAYSASKFGVIGLTQALALELAPHKINVNAVCPGTIATWGNFGGAISEAMGRGLSEEEAVNKVYADTGKLQQVPWGRIGRAQDVANVVAFLASSQSDYVTGEAINVTGGRLLTS